MCSVVIQGVDGVVGCVMSVITLRCGVVIFVDAIVERVY